MRPSGKSTLFYLFAALTVALALVVPAPRPAAASIIPATITVSKTSLENDDGNGCSLYEALQAIFNGAPYHECNAGPDMNVILFSGAALGGTITFPGKPNEIELPMINKNVTITGPITFNGNGANTDEHIFRIAPGGTLNLANMTIKNAHTSGGGAAILDLNHGTLSILGVSFESNVADGDGGAINSNGTVNILTSNFVANKARGINPDQSISPGTGYGGAIRIDGSDSLKLALSNFSGNLADKGGGAVFSGSASAEVSDDIFSGNIVDGTGTDNKAPQGGGALYNDSNTALNVVRTAFSGNLTPTSNGGAVYNKISATAAISETSFQGNIAGTPASGANGGAIYNGGGGLTLLQDTFLNNAAIKGDGGALANDRHGTATIANTSFTANAAADGNGGAINNTNTQIGGPASSVVAKNVTFSSNAVLNPGTHGGAIYNDTGHNFTLGNTIVDNSVSDNCTGTISSLGHNLDSANTCGFNQTGDLINADPKLDAPFFNGGPLVSLLTQKLLAGSAAIDKGDANICAAAPVNNIDQRGDARPKGPACDIGSFESDPLVAGYGSTPVQPGPIDFGSALLGTGTANASFDVFETGNATLNVKNLKITGANAAEFAISSPLQFNILDGGAAQTVTLTCNPKGGTAGPRTATLELDSNDPVHQHVTYNLTCVGTAVPKPAFGSEPIAPGPIDFGSATINTSVNASLLINDTGDADLHVSNPVLGGANPANFKLLTAFPIAPLAPSATTTIGLQCKPSDLGIRTATLTFTTDDSNHPTVMFNMVCSGEPAPPPLLDDPGQSVTGSGLDGAYGVAVSPDGQNVYVTGYFAKAVTAFKRNPATGALTAIQTFTNTFLNSLNGARLITVSPDGKNVYVVSTIGGGNPGGGAFVALSRDTTTGLLSNREEITSGAEAGLGGAYGVVISSDGRFVYTTGNSANAVVVWSRDVNYGFVSHTQTITSTATGDLGGARGLALSPDGTNLYVTAYSSGNASTGNLVVYKRNPVDGKLTHVQTKTECDLIPNCLFGGNYLDGLGGAFQVVVSPDGQFVYAIGTYDGAVVVFRRNGLDGSLTRIWTYKQGVGGIDGLTGVSGVTISPDGHYLYTASYGNSGSQIAAAVVVFSRDSTSGLLTVGQLIQRSPPLGGPAQPLLDGARDIRASPDGSSVYAAAFKDDAVVGLHIANPVPVLTSLGPASAQAGGLAFTLTINGESFMPGSQVKWNGANRTTTFVNNTQLTAQISAADIVAAGSADVTVFNPTPGGGVSNIAKFTITALNQNPVPSITTLLPPSAPAGGPAFTLTVNGANFITGSQVKWNGANRTTSFVNSTQLTAQISAADIAAGGPAGVTVVNPGPGGGISNAATFTIADPGENPTPAIKSLSPNRIMGSVATATDITVIINGINFIADSQAQWNGMNRPTTYVNSTQLRMIVTTADIAVGSQGSITVVNPGPGGGTSNTATFTVIPIRSRVFMPMIRR
jgi:predicted outer membrane repeat protein